MSFDAKCYDLARAFLRDFETKVAGTIYDNRAAHEAELAQEIQDVIDGFTNEKYSYVCPLHGKIQGGTECPRC